MKCNSKCCDNDIPEGDDYCEYCEHITMEEFLSTSGDFVDYFECPECGDFSPDGGWCDECLDKVDIEEHEERKREWMREQQEY